MNVPRELGRRLASEGHPYRHAGDIGMDRADDSAIVAVARTNGEVIVTHDLDYGHLLAFSGESTPSVIIFRLRKTHPDNLFARLMNVWAQVESPLKAGAIVILEDSALRIRPLPITHEDEF